MFSDLPDELETEILSRVPAKSLAELKTTCKRWYALFRDPRFVKKNFGKAASEVILLMNSRVYSISLDLDAIQNSFVPSTDLTGKLSSLDDSNLKIAEIFHCAGLLLCTVINNNSRVVVWNPCTGETRWINPRKCYRSDDYYALGYNNDNSSCHSYKILRFCRFYDSKNRLVFENEIYDFSSDSWRVVDDVTGGNCMIQCTGVSLKGNAYWFATDDKDPMGSKFILMFDFTTERFGRIPLPLPFHSIDYVDEVALSVVGEDELALLQQSVDYMGSCKMKIWTTDTKLDDAKQVSWITLLTADFGDCKLPSVTSFLWDEENRVVVCCDTDMEDKDRASIYIVGEEIHETIYKEITPGSSLTWPLLLTYVPNLVHIQKDTPKRQKKRNLAARWGGQLRKRH